ncbi:sugar phosphate isomerase/epimerase family protein [Adhaeribacter aquaticus]|uniref:sugar phosphate isomerase/epimerase family protein n=1 Tax=Adhaeribacter aquaticus TaxID=299567 RepID=UPI000415984A|nr:sugar phosphate isomerase/epimerase [Adhaeribacter aquaticus]
MLEQYSRRQFIQKSSVAAAGLLFTKSLATAASFGRRVPVSGHVWVYASKYPPEWDCTPILDQVFSDFKYAGLDGVELMESILRHEDAVSRIEHLITKYGVPVTGTSYNAAMWDRAKHHQILEDAEKVIERLHQLGGSTFGISVGDAKRLKTEAELDAQAELLLKILQICKKNKVEANLHNHTYEVKNNLHDLKGTLARIPDMKLGPDINWLIRGGVDPVWFIQSYGKQMVYIHLRDQDANGTWTEAVGEGSTDFLAIAQALKKVSFKGQAAIELAFDTPPVNSVKDDWKKSCDYVRTIFDW